MANVDITSDVKFARNLLGQFVSHMDTAALGALTETLAVGQEAAEAAAPDGPPRDDYGRRPKLKGDIHTVMLSSRSGVIRISAVNALSQETGAVPHYIFANEAENLVFWWEKENTLFVGPVVFHPGNESQEYMQQGFTAMDAAAEGILRKHYGF